MSLLHLSRRPTRDCPAIFRVRSRPPDDGPSTRPPSGAGSADVDLVDHRTVAVALRGRLGEPQEDIPADRGFVELHGDIPVEIDLLDGLRVLRSEARRVGT